MKVVMICGAGRSGTTIFGRVIAHTLDAFNVGEMIYLRSRSVDRNQLCGCGDSFSDCSFWSAVMAADPEFANNARIIESNVRWRYLPAFILNLVGLKNELTRRATKAITSMYTTVAQHSGVETIVDTSKTIPYSFLLMNTTLDVDYLLVVRNVNDVVRSTQKVKFIPELGREDRLHKRSSWFYYLQWLLILGFQGLIRTVRRRSIFVGYRHYVNDHVRINRAFWPHSAPISFDEPVQTCPQHDVAGNPSRFGEIIQLKQS